MNDVRLTIGITTRDRPEALAALSAVAGVSSRTCHPKYSCSTMPRRRRYAIRSAGWSLPLTVRVLRDDRAPGYIAGRNRLVREAAARSCC